MPERDAHSDSSGERSWKEHVPHMLWAERTYKPYRTRDPRQFKVADRSEGDDTFYKREVVKYARYLVRAVDPGGRPLDANIVSDLVQSLGRKPTPAEVAQEYDRREIFRQIERDQSWFKPAIFNAEERPQQRVIEARKNDFQNITRKEALELFANAPAEVVEETVVDNAQADTGKKLKKLVIYVDDADGNSKAHPVMTNEEQEWVNQSAKMLAESMSDAENGRVFIAGLGLGLLNEELLKLGVKNQVVAELNHQVIEKVGRPLQEKNKHLNLEIRQGDFQAKLQEAIDNGEQFDAISIDAFPNTAEEVNKDASSETVLALALKALKPGGILTFYPDSRYLPARILRALEEHGIPKSSIHYNVASFDTSDFTKEYHYGTLMAVPHIQKPVLTDDQQVRALTNSYYETRDEIIEGYRREFGTADSVLAA